MKNLLILATMAFITLSCKKDKLIDEKAVFVGTWNWSYTIHTGNYCEGFSFEDTLNPITEESNYSIGFYKNGKVAFFKDLLKISENRVVFGSGMSPFDIYLNNKDDSINHMIGYVSSTQLILIKGFPFDVYDVGCETYVSYFVKE